MMLKDASIRKCAGALGLVALVLAGAACSKDGVARADAPSSGSANNDIPAVLATIGNEQITLTDVQARVGDDLDRVETQYQRNRSTIVENALNAMLRERVLEAEAKKQGKTYEELVAAEAGGDITPTEQEIAQWYQANPTRTGGRTLDQIRTQISDLLRTEKRNAAELRLQQRLNDERKVTVNFQPYRFAFNNENAAAKGAANAPVTLVEFSDFQCPFCIRFAPTLKQVEQKYGDNVRIVYRHYPISSIHPFAFKAAEASLCANEQGKFWELHDWMFANQSKLAVRDLKQAAGDLGMDKKKFDTCLDTGRYVEQVQNDMAEGAKIGVNGTPAVFVNGIELKGGAVGLDVVFAAIDKELERAKVAN